MGKIITRVPAGLLMLVSLLSVGLSDLRSENIIDFEKKEKSLRLDVKGKTYTLDEYPDLEFVWYPGVDDQGFRQEYDVGVYIVRVFNTVEDNIKHIVIPDSVTAVNYIIDERGEEPIPGKLYPVVGTGNFYDSSKFTWDSNGEVYWDAPNIQTIHFPKTITSLCIDRFYNLESLREIIIDKENKVYTDYEGILYKSDINNDLKKLLYFPASWDKRSHFEIPLGTETIEGESFSGNRLLESVVIPESVSNILGGPFYQCEKLTEVHYKCPSAKTVSLGNGNILLREVNLSNGFETIKSYGFRGNENLVKVAGTAGIRKIEERAFEGDRVMFLNLSDVDSIGYRGLGRCQAIMLGDNPNMEVADKFTITPKGTYLSMCVKSAVPPEYFYSGYSPPSSDPNDEAVGRFMYGGTLYVPQNAISTYRNHRYWGNFTNILPISDKLIPLVSEPTLIVFPGQVHQYYWDVMPMGKAQPEGSFSWSVADSSIASIDSKGRLTAIAPGKTTVIFTLYDTKGNRYTATSEVKVYADPSDIEEVVTEDRTLPRSSEAVYDLQGRYLGPSTDRVAPGIYIIHNSEGSRKVAVM